MRRRASVDVHAIVLDPARTRSPGATALRAPVNLYGGAYVEVAADELDDALVAIDDWLRPSWLELRLGDHPVPSEVRAGGGFTQRDPAPGRAAVRAHRPRRGAGSPPRRPPRPPRRSPRSRSAAPPPPTSPARRSDRADVIAAGPSFEHALAAHPFAERRALAFAVLRAAGRVAKSRRDDGRRRRPLRARDRVRRSDEPALAATVAPPPRRRIGDRAAHARAAVPRPAPAQGVRLLPARARPRRRSSPARCTSSSAWAAARSPRSRSPASATRSSTRACSMRRTCSRRRSPTSASTPTTRRSRTTRSRSSAATSRR